MSRPVYLDYHATTPVDPRVLDAMLPYFTEQFGNPASRQHAYGWKAQEAVDRGRSQVAALIGASAGEIAERGTKSRATVPRVSQRASISVETGGMNR